MMIIASILVCAVVGVADGDTLTVRCGDEPQARIRLAEIDAPEKSHPFGQRSKHALASLCFNQQAIVTPATKDRYGRTVGAVECNGKDAGTEQVQSGMAWVYKRYADKHSPLYGFEQEAREARRGLWTESEPVPPWEWRHARRTKQ